MTNINTLTRLLVLSCVPLVAACANPEVVSERQAGDTSLSCEQISAEIEEASKFAERARDEKGVTGTNVAAGLLFWPALLVTYSNAEEAIDAAEDREDRLYQLADQKGCRI